MISKVSSSLSVKFKQVTLASLLAVLGVTNAFAQASAATEKAAPPAQLGNVSFPNSGPASVQEPFLRGLAALHSFWYEEAIEQFQIATKIDPDFALGYWGEALAYTHTLWSAQDLEYGRKTLAKIKDTSNLTPRERAYIDAARQLYGEGDKLTRDIAYSKALDKIHQDYPDDLEASAFYALSILGTVRPVDLKTQGYARQEKAGAIATEVYRKNPQHPGAAHYIIHAYDDPAHARIALDAARHYAAIAPEAFHAQHMPSHIFVQLGLWSESAKSNETSWRVSDEWVKRKNYSLKLRDYHSYHWLVYTYLQQGRQKEAEKLLGYIRETIKENGPRSVNFYEQIASTYIVETKSWDRAAELLAKPASPIPDVASAPVEICGPNGGSTLTRDSQRRSDLPAIILALAEGERSAADAGDLLKKVESTPLTSDDIFTKNTRQIQLLQLKGINQFAQGQKDEALKSLAAAAKLEEETSKPSGPPSLIKPSNELYGEFLLTTGHAKEAVQQFETSLSRQPGRALSLLGLARAKDKAGDRAGAAAAYNTLLQNWSQADSDLPALAEARAYVKTQTVASIE